MLRASSTTIDAKTERRFADKRDGKVRPVSARRTPATQNPRGTVVAYPRAPTGAREDQTQVVGSWAY